MTMLKSILAAGAMAVLGTAASASTMQLSYATSHGQNVTISAAPSGIITGGVWAGAFTMTNTADAFDQFLAFCLDASSAILGGLATLAAARRPTGPRSTGGQIGRPFALPAGMFRARNIPAPPCCGGRLPAAAPVPADVRHAPFPHALPSLTVDA